MTSKNPRKYFLNTTTIFAADNLIQDIGFHHHNIEYAKKHLDLKSYTHFAMTEEENSKISAGSF